MRILVGMSGGLDSTYAALKLINEGHDVEGAVIVMHDYTELDAARTAARNLGIVLHEVDATEKFSAVKENFVSEYSRGRTPNPCIVCNPLVKFRVLADFAIAGGFDRIATGHYARELTVSDGTSTRHTLARALDERKDQTYMLHRLPEDILSILLLPLGDEIKTDVREKAKAAGLESADRKESQEICFIPDGDYASYIENVNGVFPEGDFVLDDGRVVGRHRGIIRYTVGQRKGLGVAFGERIFVSRIDALKNEIVLSPEGSYRDFLEVSDTVFSGMSEQKKGTRIRASAKLRYLARPVSTEVIFLGDGRLRLALDTPQKAVTPGQSAVIYDGDTVLFGGFID
ncbi:MAG: tRNA 2-thiouridine(34) synthase MnmA [Clostridia bacterium]|nr:tRNA 2-thiouridine(34) synthase MnmA [Clostridia bacterium]